jgi:hypothetical protein
MKGFAFFVQVELLRGQWLNVLVRKWVGRGVIHRYVLWLVTSSVRALLRFIVNGIKKGDSFESPFNFSQLLIKLQA